MNRTFFLCALIFSMHFSFAQNFSEEGVEYAKTITAEELKEHLEIIASDEYEGRETGKKGQKMAMEYLIENFKEYGIQPIPNHDYTQSFTLIEQENTNIEVSINNKDLKLFEDFYLFNTFLPEKNIDSKIMFAAYGIPDKDSQKYNGIDASGNVIMLLDNIALDNKESEMDLKQRIDLAKKNGVEAIIVVSEDFRTDLIKRDHYIREKRMLLQDADMEKNIPIIYTSIESAEKIFKEFNYKDFQKRKKLKNLPEALPITINIDKPSEKFISENVLAFIPGTDLKNEVIILTAHYDHIGMNDSLIFNGADDDGTGTVALLEIAEAFMTAKAAGKGPRRSILIMPVSGEEKGLLGSRFYSENPVFPLENTVANLNVDMIGRIDDTYKDDPDYIYLIGSDRLSQDLHNISENVANQYSDLKLDYTFNEENDPNRFYYRSDHYNFAKNNVPVIFYFSGVHEDYHKSTDTVDKILFDKVEKVSRLIFLTAWELANREERIRLNQKPN